MIPLALYALDYPKVPLLLVDFRNTHAPKQREMLRRAATEVAGGILGISGRSNLPYLAGSFTFNFIRVRHGAANDRGARLKAYSQVRQWLALDHSLQPDLRTELLQRLETLGVNPMQDSIFDEARIARRQYAALIRYAGDPEGLPARIEQDRRAELTAYAHGLPARAGLHLASWSTFGLYKHRERDNETLEARLDEERRVARQLRFLDDVARSSPQPEVVWSLDELKRAVDQVPANRIPARSEKLVERIRQQTRDAATRASSERIPDTRNDEIAQ
jgi:hypothetical protein